MELKDNAVLKILNRAAKEAKELTEYNITVKGYLIDFARNYIEFLSSVFGAPRNEFSYTFKINDGTIHILPQNMFTWILACGEYVPWQDCRGTNEFTDYKAAKHFSINKAGRWIINLN